MYHNILKQQTILNRAFSKSYFLFALIIFGFTLSSYSFLNSNIPSGTNLVESVFLRYNIFFGIIPTFTIVLLSTLKYSLADALCCQGRKVFVVQTIYRILIGIIIMAVTWLLTIIPIIVVSGYSSIFLKIWPNIMFRMIYLWLVLISFGYLTATIYFVSNNKLISFILIQCINSLAFLLNVNGKFSLFYDFVRPDLGSMIFTFLIVLLGLILILDAVLNLVIAKKDIS